MNELIEELQKIREELQAATRFANDLAYRYTLNSLLENIEHVENAWCGSWYGYRADVYYKDFGSPPLDMFIGDNWEHVAESMSGSTQRSGWHRYPEGRVKDRIEEGIERRDIRNAFEHTLEWISAFKGKRADVLAIIGIAQENRNSIFDGLANQIENLRVQTVDEIVQEETPDQMETDDRVAQQQGIRIPPHIRYKARVLWSIRAAGIVNEFAILVGKTMGQMERVFSTAFAPQIAGTNIFIGHGGSAEWEKLQAFLQNRLNLEIAEFDKNLPASKHILDHILELIRRSAVACIVLTSEDTLENGTHHPRLNVVHELGLCQAIIGVGNTIILLEQDCEEFSNISGLVQIRFPKGNIEAAFEEIRRVLEDRGIIPR